MNQVTGRGRHTSSSTVSLRYEGPGGTGWVIDTPGVRSFGLGHVDPANILAAFTELAVIAKDCPRGCTHLPDAPDCALIEAAERGELSETGRARLDSLQRLLQTFADKAEQPAGGEAGGVTERLGTGTAAPDFSLLDQDGNTVRLADLRGTKTVLYFYPAAMTPGCTTEACDFRDSISSLQGAGYQVVGVSRDEPAKLAAFRDRDALTFPLLSDPDHAVHEAYGAWGEKMNYGKGVEGVIRSTFVLDEDGLITSAQYNVKATGHVARLRKQLGVDA